MAPTPQTQLPEWVRQVNQAIPAVITAAVLGIFAVLWEQSTSVRGQKEQLAEMARTLKTVCEQLADKKATDAVQNERLNILRSDVDALLRNP